MARKRRSEAAAQVESDLKYWGYHVGKQFAADGYPSECPLLLLLSGHSDLNPLSSKFGVNVADIPGEAWQINSAVMKLRGELRGVLVGRYALPMDYLTGQPIDARIIAEALNMTIRTYFRRLTEARDLYLRRAAAFEVRIEAFGACAESTT